ncbi:3-deoxy-D-manno-octulosonic acid transferase [Indioceanicola profundi]|uniref:3-deoxy-D-manno-octulosonic acid transferase n=1 Tax=Indioceanicola profundi TaxID=2220096 RepID=UPI000E6AE107|nr:3-deoxy-D-manno-octulosonic acid transferase [Indioceanicola profundi]
MLELLYRGLTHLAGPAVGRLLDRRAARGKEDPLRRHERLGRPSLPRPAGRLIWLHAASVGESLAILPLVERLLALSPTAHVLVTTGTVTSATLMDKRLPARAFHQYVPVDLPGAAKRFVDHWRPDMVLWVESEFWPNLLGEVRRRGLPCGLINARISEKSFRSWRRVPRTSRRLLSVFQLALAQTAEGAERLCALGIREVRAVGNLKYSAAPLPADPEMLASLRAAVGSRPVWAFASTHPGEEALVPTVHRRAALPGLLSIIVPRHPARGAEVAELLRGQGMSVAVRSVDGAPRPEHEAYVVDTLGELGLVYRLAPVAVIGGSFAGIGGHNPIEPALLGAAVVHGPSMHNFAEVAAELQARGGALNVPDGDALPGLVRDLLTDGMARARLADAALAVAEENRQAVDRVLAALDPLLARAGFAEEIWGSVE